MSPPTLVRGSDAAAMQALVLRSIGSRGYRGPVDRIVRLAVMRRVRLNGKALSHVSLAAMAISNYRKEIGDQSWSLWRDLSDDAGIVSSERPSVSICRLDGWDDRGGIHLIESMRRAEAKRAERAKGGG